MAIDPAQIELSVAQKKQLARIAEKKGKDYSAIVDELLSSVAFSGQNRTSVTRERVAQVEDDFVEDDFTDEPSLYNELARRGILGCFDGPTDLSTNPKHMEGFGR